jgi:hypothetical protein
MLTSNRKFVANWGSKSSQDSQFLRPYGLRIDPAGKVYVTASDPLSELFATIRKIYKILITNICFK